MIDGRRFVVAEQTIYRFLGGSVYQRAKDYYQRHLVLSAEVDGASLSAEVAGSDDIPYDVVVKLASDEIKGSCSCLYDHGPCKHVGAVLLAWLHEPEAFRGYNPGSDHAAQATQTATRSASPAVDPVLAMSVPEDVLPDGARPDVELAQLLEGRTVSELRRIARRRGIPLRGNSKVELVAQLAAGIIERQSLEAALRELNASQLVVLDLVHLLGRGNLIGPGRIADALAALEISPPGDLTTTLADLSERGLLASGQHGSYEDNHYCLPASIALRLSPADYLIRRAASQALPSRKKGGELNVDEILYLVWRHFQQHTVKRRPLLQQTLFEKTSEHMRGWHNVPEEVVMLQSRNREALAGVAVTALPPPPAIDDDDLVHLAGLAGDVERAEFAYHLLRQLRLVSGRDRFAVSEEAMRQFLRYSASRRRCAAASAWLRVTDWSELTIALRHDHKLKLRRLIGKYESLKPKDLFDNLAATRRFFVRLLLRLEEGVWYSLPGLLETFRCLSPDNFADCIVRQGMTQPRWWLEAEGDRRLDPRRPDDWARGYGRFAVEILRGPLSWLGVASVGRISGEEVFRIDGLHDLLTDAPGQEASPSSLSVAEDLTITVPPGFGDLTVHDFLTSVAEPVEASLEGVRYQLTATRACDAFAAGHDAASIVAFLEGAAACSIPDSVRIRLDDWWQRYGSLRLYSNLTLLEFADDYTLPELLASTSLGQHLVYQLSPRIVVVDPQAIDGVMSELVRKGYTPKVAEAGG